MQQKHLLFCIAALLCMTVFAAPVAAETITETFPADATSPPVAAFGADVTTGDAPLAVQFTDESTNDPTSWAWDFENDGTVDSTEQNPSYTYATAGTYTVSLTATNAVGSDDEVKTAYIVVSEGSSPASVFTYTSDGSAITITGYTGPAGDVVIPGTIEGLPVTTIRNNAFKSNTPISNTAAITSVTVPDSVTSIGSGAFCSCTALTAINIGSGVTSIGSDAFCSCTALTAINVDAGNTEFASVDGVLYNKAITTLVQCPGGKASVTIPDSVTSIGDSAFSGCTALTAIDVDPGNSVYASVDGVLYDKAMTTLIECPEGITDPVVIPSGVTSIGEGAFKRCYALTAITIPDSVTSIPSQAFMQCGSLTSVTIPDSVTSIHSCAFMQCGSLTSVTIPDSVTSIGQSAFFDCGSLTSVTIPDSVTSIGDSAFRYCIGLTSVTIGNGVTSIGEQAFSDCRSLASVTIPDSVTTIGDSAFLSCWALSSITIPDSVTSIGDWAFRYCTSLTSVTIPDSVTSIGESAFSDCTSLASVTIPDSVTSIGEQAFYKCTSLTSVTIPDSVTSISEQAFYGCTSLTSVTIGSGVTSIGKSAFYGCTSLTTVTIGGGVTSIDKYAFNACTSLASMTFEGNAPTVGSTWANVPASMTVYYLAGATGFNYQWNGFYTVMLVGSPPTADFFASPLSGDAPLTVQFTDASTGSPTSWSWDFENDGAVDSTDQNPVHTYDTKGTYTVSLTVTNATGSDSEVKTGYITVSGGDAPVAAFSADVTSGDAPLVVKFTGLSTNSPTSRLWSFGDGATSEDQHPTHVYTAAGTYTVNLTVSNALGSDSEVKTDYITVTVGESSPYAVKVVDYQGPFDSGWYGDPNAVLGKPATYIDEPYLTGDFDTFRVKLVEPAQATDLGGNNVITKLNSGSYITVVFDHPVENDPNNPYGIDLLVYGNAFFVGSGFVSDLSDMDEYMLTSGIFAEPVTVAVSQDNVNWYTFTDGPFADDMFPTQAYQWDSATHSWTDTEMDFTRPVDPSLTVDDFAGLTAAQAIALYDGSGGGTGYDIGVFGLDWIQYVKVTSNSEGEIDAFADVAPQQLSAPVADFSANVTSGDASLAVQFTDLSTGDPTAWAWDFDNDGTVDSTEQNPAHTYDAAGTYTVTLTATNAAGSDSEVKTDYITVTVPEATPFPNPAGGTFPAPTDPDGDGLYEDLDGNGWIGFNDVIVCYDNLEAIEAGTYGSVSLFGYDGNGWIGFNDVIGLFGRI